MLVRLIFVEVVLNLLYSFQFAGIEQDVELRREHIKHIGILCGLLHVFIDIVAYVLLRGQAHHSGIDSHDFVLLHIAVDGVYPEEAVVVDEP